MRTTVVELFVVPRSRSELLEHQGTLGTRGIDIREGQAYGFRRGVMVPTLKLAIPISQIVIPSARHGEHVPGHHRLLAANLADDVGHFLGPSAEKQCVAEDAVLTGYTLPLGHFFVHLRRIRVS